MTNETKKKTSAAKKEKTPNTKPEAAAKTKIRHHGQSFVGTVISTRMSKTATVMWERRRYVRKYERYEKKRTKVHAHNPPELNVKTGDIVRITQTKPLSKTKHFTITEVIKTKGE